MHSYFIVEFLITNQINSKNIYPKEIEIYEVFIK